MSTESSESSESSESVESPDRTVTAAEELPARSAASKPSGAKTSPARILLYLGLGAVAIYLSIWVGPVAFHLHFQGLMVAAREEVPGLAIWTRAEEVPAVRAAGWTFRKEDPVVIPVPPGAPKFSREDGTVVAAFEEGTITYRHFPAGFLVSLVQKEAEVVGATVGETASDASVLRELLAETCENYEFGWPRARRSLYAARILSKMLLWEEKTLRQFQFASGEGALSVLAEYDSGAAAIVVAGDDGVLVVRVPEDGPASWKTSAADWLPSA